MRRMLAPLILALAAISAAPILALVANADPGADANFVQELSAYGMSPATLHKPNWTMVVYMGQATCYDLRTPGVDANEMVKNMQRDLPNLSQTDIQFLVSAAVGAYCPDLPKQLPWVCAEFRKSPGCQ
jgi:hypothetical protein